MYQVIQNIINHTWVTNDSAQQYIYYIAGVAILLILVYFLDCFRSLVHCFSRKK